MRKWVGSRCEILHRSEMLQKLLEEFGGIQKEVMIKLEGDSYPYIFIDPLPFFTWEFNPSRESNAGESTTRIRT